MTLDFGILVEEAALGVLAELRTLVLQPIFSTTVHIGVGLMLVSNVPPRAGTLLAEIFMNAHQLSLVNGLDRRPLQMKLRRFDDALSLRHQDVIIRGAVVSLLVVIQEAGCLFHFG